MKTSELIDHNLDWAVGSCTNPNANPEWPYGKITWSPLWKCYTIPNPKNAATRVEWHPSTDWAQGGPTIEREKIATEWTPNNEWRACIEWLDEPTYEGFGPTPLIAAMRCYVASKLGDEVEIPKELK